LKSELETLHGEIANLGTQIEVLRVNHCEANEAWRASGGPERDEEMEKVRRRLYGS
jgi:hypothetical protein